MVNSTLDRFCGTGMLESVVNAGDDVIYASFATQLTVVLLRSGTFVDCDGSHYGLLNW